MKASVMVITPKRLVSYLMMLILRQIIVQVAQWDVLSVVSWNKNAMYIKRTGATRFNSCGTGLFAQHARALTGASP